MVYELNDYLLRRPDKVMSFCFSMDSAQTRITGRVSVNMLHRILGLSHLIFPVLETAVVNGTQIKPSQLRLFGYKEK